MLFDDVGNEVKRILEGNREVVSEWMAGRKRFEVWVQRAIFNDLSFERPNVRREVAYPNSKGWVDFWERGPDSAERWVELKLCVTNYAHSFTERVASRPVTNQI